MRHSALWTNVNLCVSLRGFLWWEWAGGRDGTHPQLYLGILPVHCWGVASGAQGLLNAQWTRDVRSYACNVCALVFGDISLIPMRYFWMNLTVKSVEWVKQLAIPDMGGSYLINWRSKLTFRRSIFSWVRGIFLSMTAFNRRHSIFLFSFLPLNSHPNIVSCWVTSLLVSWQELQHLLSKVSMPWWGDLGTGLLSQLWVNF